MKKPLSFLLIFIFPVFLFSAEPEKRDLLREKAAAGDAEACFRLGNEYFYGENGRKANEMVARHWYKKAAQKGLAEGCYNYAICLERAAKTPEEVFAAFQWYQKAARQDSDPARYRIAAMYATGITGEKGKVLLKKSPASSLLELEILNSHDYEPGQLRLSRLLIESSADEKNRARAFPILKNVTSKKNCSAIAYRLLADCYYDGIGCKKDIRQCIFLLEKAHSMGDIEATAKLGYLYETGAEGIEPDLLKSFQFYRTAALKGVPMAQYKYAEAVFNDRAPEKGVGIKDAMEWYRKSAAGGCVQAMYTLGMILLEGRNGIPVNKDAAASCFFEAAKRGYAPAQYEFGCLFAEGAGVRNKDDSAAFYWFSRAAAQGYPAALRRAGLALINGLGTERNRIVGLQMLENAAKKGDMTAFRMMETMR